MDLSKLSDTELKALGFEESIKRDTAAQNIQLVISELQSRQPQPETKKKTSPE